MALSYYVHMHTTIAGFRVRVKGFFPALNEDGKKSHPLLVL